MRSQRSVAKKFNMIMANGQTTEEFVNVLACGRSCDQRVLSPQTRNAHSATTTWVFTTTSVCLRKQGYLITLRGLEMPH